MKNVIELLLISILIAGVLGCSIEANANPGAKPSGTVVIIPARTLFKVALTDGLHSDTNSGGDTFLAILAEPIVVNGITVLEEGTTVSGSVLGSVESGLVYGQASLRFALTSITSGERTVPILTNTFAVTTASTGKRGAEILAGGSGFAFSDSGNEINYDPGTRLNFTLSESVRM